MTGNPWVAMVVFGVLGALIGAGGLSGAK